LEKRSPTLATEFTDFADYFVAAAIAAGRPGQKDQESVKISEICGSTSR